MTRTLLLTGFLVSSLAHAQGLDHVKEETAKAIHIPTSPKEWTLSGTESLHGTQHRYTLTFDRQFRFRSTASGSMPESEVFDGSSLWQLNWSGIPVQAWYSDRDIARLEIYVRTGLWAAKDSPVAVVSQDQEGYTIRCKDGSTTAKLTLDTQSHLPKTFSYWGASGDQVWTYSNYQLVAGLMMPTQSIRTSQGSRDEIVIESGAVQSPTSHSESYLPPAEDVTGFAYDPALKSEVEVKRIAGYVFVKPNLNGRDEGWFFVDTGAEVMVLDSNVAKELNAKTVGNENVAGVVGSVTTNFVNGIDFQLGPAKLKDPTYMLLDMSGFSKILGIKLAGICGYDFIGRVSLDINPNLSTVGIYPSGKVALPSGATWTPFKFLGSVPSIECQFEGNHQGIFTLDTGSGSTIDFFTPTVKKYNLLKDRKVTSNRTGGAGGEAVSKAGSIDWFQMGPRRFERPRAIFQTTERGEFASPFSDGNIGMGLLGQYRLIIDYRNLRIAFVDKN